MHIIIFQNMSCLKKIYHHSTFTTLLLQEIVRVLSRMIKRNNTFSYNTVNLHELGQQNHCQCHYFLKAAENENFMDNILLSGEATFH
jgi:hypothetical protein